MTLELLEEEKLRLENEGIIVYSLYTFNDFDE